MQEIFDLYNKKIVDRESAIGREMSIKSIASFANVSEDVAEVFIDKCKTFPSEFYKENGKDIGMIKSLQKLERVIKIRKVAKLTRLC